MNHVLVTGTAGFIGYHVTSKLLRSGYKVIGVDNLNDYYDVRLKHARLERLRAYNSFNFRHIDVADNEAIQTLFSTEQFDLVIHLAAQAGVQFSLQSPHIYLSSNVLGFLNICEACRAHDISNLIYASSSSVYGENKEIPFSEDQAVAKPVSFYAATKISNEATAYAYSHLYGINTFGLRFFTVYGPWGRPDMAYWKFTESIIRRETISLFFEGNAQRDFTFIEDVVEAIATMTSTLTSNARYRGQSQARIYNVGNHTPVSLLEFVRTLEDILEQRAVVELAPPQPGDVEITYADVTRLHDDFGFKPDTSLTTGLRSFVDWYCNDWARIQGGS